MIAAVTAPTPPLAWAVDETSVDAEILLAYEQQRQDRATLYRLEDVNRGDWPEGAFEERDARQRDLEKVVEDSWAESVPGVVAQIQIMMAHLTDARWVDRGLAERGLMALVRNLDAIEYPACKFVEIAHELVAIEWEAAVREYEAASAGFNLALRLKSHVEGELFRQSRSGGASAFVQQLSDMCDEAESLLGSEKHLQRLIRTLVPDQVAFHRKVQIILAEGVTDDVTPWLARDGEFLLGGLAADLSNGGK